MYKPGDKINFRILVLDPNLKPSAIRGDMRVFISVSWNGKVEEVDEDNQIIGTHFKTFRTAQTIALNSG